MTSKDDLIVYAGHVASNPKVAAAVSGAAITSGVSTYLEWISRGVGIAASVAGFLLAVALIRKAMAEHGNTKLVSEKLHLEIQALKRAQDI